MGTARSRLTKKAGALFLEKAPLISILVLAVESAHAKF
jgi:hypothetical protein